MPIKAALFAFSFFLLTPLSHADLRDAVKEVVRPFAEMAGVVEPRPQFTKSPTEQEVDFDMLKNCYNSTNFIHSKLEPRYFQRSSYNGLVDQTNINALILRQENPDKLVVMQKSGANSYNLQREHFERNACDSMMGGIGVPVEGVHNQTTAMTVLRLRIREHHVRGAGYQKQFCSPSAARNLNNTGLVPTAMNTGDDARRIVTEAITDRLTWLADHMTPELVVYRGTNYKDLFKGALDNNGYCFEVLDMFPGLQAMRDRLYCKMDSGYVANCLEIETQFQSGTPTRN